MEVNDTSLAKYEALIISLVKKDLVNIMNGKKRKLETSLKSAVLQIWLNGYDNGLKDMDRMHATIDHQIDSQ